MRILLSASYQRCRQRSISGKPPNIADYYVKNYVDIMSAKQNKDMPGFVTNIEKDAKENGNFRKVIFTAPHSQLVLMSLKPNEEIGNEVHEENDQFFRVDEGEGKVVFDNTEEHVISDGFAVVVPAGVWHNVINTSSEKELKLYTIYSPSHHPDATIHKTKEEAMAGEKE